MIKLYFCIIVGVFVTQILVGQKNPKIDQKIYFSNQEGVIQAKKTFKNAERYYRKGAGTYDEALKYYMNLYTYNSESHALNYKIGICYLWTSNKKASLEYFLKSSPEVAKDYYLALGRSYQYNLMFNEAKESYSQHLNSLHPWLQNDAKSYIDQLSKECDISAEIMQDSLSAYVINLGPVINSYYDDYGAILPENDTNIYFTSKRPEVEPNRRVSRFKFKERVLMTNNCINEPSQYASELPKLRFRVNLSLAGFSKNEKKIYLYGGKKNNGGIYSAIYEEGKWRKVRPIKGKINHIAYKETTISFSQDGTAYFVSNKRGGVGGKDIYLSKIKNGRAYGKPINLGKVINTSFDEECVYISKDGNTLFFSSNGHLGMGGFDVYKSEKGLDGEWETPQNMGHPINSPADELFYKPTADTMVALYSTIRPDSYGGLDIYKIQLDPRIPFKLIGSVTDMEDGTALPASVNVYDKNTQKMVYSTKVDSLAGIYLQDFEDVGDYTIQIDYKGYKSASFDLPRPDVKYATLVQDFTLERLRHPFTLIGRVTDVDKGTPVQASISFKHAIADSLIGRVVSDTETGKYSITFEDKYDMVMNIEAVDYFPVHEPINTTNEINKVFSKNIELKRSKINYTLTGRIAEEDETTPVRAALSFYEPGKLEPFTIILSDSTNGKYTAIIDNAGPFMIEVEANGYFFTNEIYQFPEGQTFTAKNFNLKKMESGVKIVIENILFNSGKSTLKVESFKEIDKMAELLEKNPKVRIEVSGHTDNVGSASVNKRISKARALTVKNYLVSRGILEDRIEYQGYGFDQPISPNDTPEGRAKNRRVEIKILD
ncbi:MAG: OmpA family protein [Salinivirgaceae bacterium]|nr:OmpA family protein [Salinivirgaceae bacterium]